MANGTLAAGDDAPRLIDALHRIYLASLPPDELDTIITRVPDRVRGLDLADAFDMLAESDLDHSQRWHMIATALHRQPTIVDFEDVKKSVGRAVIGKPIPGLDIDNAVVEEQLTDFASRRKPDRPDRDVDLPPRGE